MSWLRVVFAGLIVGAVLVVVQSVSPDWGLVEIGAAIAAAIIAIMATLGLVGPFAIGKLAARRHRRARSAHELIPARNVVESPKAAWRQVSGLALACFIVVPTAPVLGHLDLIERGGTPIDAATRQSFSDVRTVVLATVVISFLLVACSVGVTQAAAVLERHLYISLDRIWMQQPEMNPTRRLAVGASLRVAVPGTCWPPAVS